MKKHTILNIFIFLAGLTFLIYEVSWHRMLALVMGSTVTASTIVLATFMAGFGSGAWFWGRIGDYRNDVWKMLVFLMISIGICGVAGYDLIFGHAQSNVVSVLLLFIQTFMMGGVFPLVCKLAIKSDSKLASEVGKLFAIETLGSTIGGLLAGFWLLGTFGQKNTVMIAVVINALMAIWMLVTRMKSETHSVTEVQGKDLPSMRRIALLTTFACGFVNLGLQVAWMRMFRIYLTNTSYTFALVSSMSILGLFIGSYIFRKKADKISDYPKTMLKTVMLMVLASIVSLILLIQLPEIFMFPLKSILSNPLNRILLLPMIASIFIVIPPALFSGFAFPLACRMYSESAGNVSRDVGFVMMVNTVGSVLGPLAVAFILMPMIGAALSVFVMAMILMVVAVLANIQSKVQGPLGFFVYSGVVILITIFVLQPEVTILPPSFHAFDRDLLYYNESVEGTISVGQDRNTRSEAKYTFVNNSAVIGSTYDAIKVVKMVGHLPFLAGGKINDVLVIGFGIGVTTSAIASHDEVESIKCVELVTGLTDAARFYSDMNMNVVLDPRLDVVSGDGRHYLQKTKEKFDLISCDPTHPILGSGSLYTSDYFQSCKDHLNPGGFVSQYLPLHKLGSDEFIGIMKTFQSVFPDCTIWLGNFHAVLLGSTDPIQIDFAQWSERVKEMEVDKNFYIEANHLAATFFLDGETVAKLGAELSLNTDDLSYTEFFDADCLDPMNLSLNLDTFLKNRSDVSEIFSNVENVELLTRYVKGNQLMTKSLAVQLGGGNGLGYLQQACSINPEDPEYPFLIKLNY
jgi:spermidine synthase